MTFKRSVYNGQIVIILLNSKLHTAMHSYNQEMLDKVLSLELSLGNALTERFKKDGTY